MGKNRSGQSCSISCEDVVGNGDDLLWEVGIADNSLEDEKQQDGSDSQGENSDEVCDSMESKGGKDLLEEDGRVDWETDSDS